MTKQVKPTAADAVNAKSKKNANKIKPSTKVSKAVPVEAVEKKAWKAEQSKASEKRGVKAPKVDETEKKVDKTAPSAPVSTTSRQTKKKQRQQQQQASVDIAVAPAAVADTSSSPKKKKKKAVAAEKRRNSLGATTTGQSSPSEAAPIAPPPGLAAPPGFLSNKEKDAGLPAPSADDASLSNLSQIPLDGGVGAPSGLGGTELWLGGNASSPLGRDNQESLSPALSGLQNDRPLGASGNTDSFSLGGSLPLLDQASPGFLRGRPLLGGGGGFNVQSFLDTILDESEMVEDDYEEDGGRDVGGSPLALGSGPGANDGLADAIATATAIGDHTSDLLVPQRRFSGIGGVSNDPWSAPNISSSSALPTVPLLTPEQILRENDAADSEENNKKEEDGSHLMALFGANEDGNA